jgi:hypothetical protein
VTDEKEGQAQVTPKEVRAAANAKEAALARFDRELIDDGRVSPRTILEVHPVWHELVRDHDLTVVWREDGVEVKDCSPEVGAALQDIITLVVGNIHGYQIRMARDPRRPGLRAGFSV